MITDDERREVAEKLRASIPGDGVMRRGDKGWSLLYRTIFGHYMGHQSSGRTYSEVAGRLADLIETRMPTDDERPVLANGKRGMFRGWFQVSYMNGRATIAHPVAVVELEDGSCETFQACMIKFLDVEVKSDDNR